ncbi:hypothetical protein ACTXT7_001595 [Hymenolepis weldensis]
MVNVLHCKVKGQELDVHQCTSSRRDRLDDREKSITLKSSYFKESLPCSSTLRASAQGVASCNLPSKKLKFRYLLTLAR